MYSNKPVGMETCAEGGVAGRGVVGGVVEPSRGGTRDPIPLSTHRNKRTHTHTNKHKVGTRRRLGGGLDSQQSGKFHQVDFSHVTHHLVHAVKRPGG